MTDVVTHYGRIRAALAAAEAKRAGDVPYTGRITVALLPTTIGMITEMAAELRCSRSEIIRCAIEEYAKDFRFRRGR